MNLKIAALATSGLLLAGTSVLAANAPGGTSPGASGFSPGHEMQQGHETGTNERESGPGASGYSPGHEMKENEGRTGALDKDRDDNNKRDFDRDRHEGSALDKDRDKRSDRDFEKGEHQSSEAEERERHSEDFDRDRNRGDRD